MPRSVEPRAPDGRPEAPEQQLIAGWNRVLYTLAPPGDALAPAAVYAGAEPRRRIPVTVLSGLLGAGKTTLLCRLLDASSEAVLAIVNDLATLNVDAMRVRETDRETLQLENGCACCVLGSDLDAMLSEISRRATPPQRIVVEASGVSDPLGIAQTIASNTGTVLDGIVTLVDAGSLPALSTDPQMARLFQRQLDAAHLVALTRTEDGAHVVALREQLGALAPGRPVIALDDTRADLCELILGASCRGARPAPAQEEHRYSGFGATVIRSQLPADADAFFALMARIPSCVYRIKGWLRLQNGNRVQRQELQAVGSRWRVTPAAAVTMDDQLVIIGRSGESDLQRFAGELRAMIDSSSPSDEYVRASQATAGDALHSPHANKEGNAV
ncbi:MAG: GTP-binding protein [Pseudomonadales bacterium]|nr:GTP-binding protein [Pseudomonadales bacterium]MCP5183906.1 GTP-binding protein [Pseudomonadales bacterium]